MTFSPTRIIAGTPRAGPRVFDGRFARAALVLAWVIFWLNTAFFPCCEAIAAAFNDHSDSVSHSTPAVQPGHHSEETHTEHSAPAPSSHCDATLNAQPAIDGVHGALLTDRIDSDTFAVVTSVALGMTTEIYSASPAPRDYHPPPPFRRYLHTQRLLI